MKNRNGKLRRTKPPARADGTAAPTSEKSLQKINPALEVRKAEGRADVEAIVDKVLVEATGISNPNLARLIIGQVYQMQPPWPVEEGVERMRAMMAMVREMKPESAMEAHLAVQMIGVHNAAIIFMNNVTLAGQPYAGSDANLARATSLMRLHSELAETMLKLKGKTGQQKVTVEHVHVHEGGQAIVGAVSSAKADQGEGGASEKRKNTP